MAQDSDYDEMYKIVLVGDPAVGKTNLLAYYTADAQGQTPGADGSVASFKKNRKPTVGVEFATSIVKHPNGSRIKAQIWDTAGQERYRAITSSHYRRAAGALLVYDVADRKTFENGKNVWLQELQMTAEEDSTLRTCTMLVGNKIDLTPVVSEAEHQAAVQSLGLTLEARTSAKTGEGVKNAFNDLVIAVYDADKTKQGKVKGPEKLTVGATNQQQGGRCC